MIDKLLEKYGLKYDDLKPEERETLNVWMDAIQKGAISVEKIREYILAMKDAVERDLSKSSLGNKNDIFLKARLRNYLLLEAFLVSPERAKQEMENAISGLVKKV